MPKLDSVLATLLDSTMCLPSPAPQYQPSFHGTKVARSQRKPDGVSFRPQSAFCRCQNPIESVAFHEKLHRSVLYNLLVFLIVSCQVCQVVYFLAPPSFGLGSKQVVLCFATPLGATPRRAATPRDEPPSGQFLRSSKLRVAPRDKEMMRQSRFLRAQEEI